MKVKFNFAFNDIKRLESCPESEIRDCQHLQLAYWYIDPDSMSGSPRRSETDLELAQVPTESYANINEGIFEVQVQEKHAPQFTAAEFRKQDLRTEFIELLIELATRTS